MLILNNTTPPQKEHFIIDVDKFFPLLTEYYECEESENEDEIT